ncbi:MAG: aminotransferase class IV [Pseudomonadales bacterium]|jgi:D-alanine transaminase|nr:aminotransferase class IV [Gammaproteobacteria bacterium]MBP6052383.1 aminotransferase class IV [Pseudomonadales bacterium]MBK6584833.1 aminotransferase class IV [Gammaproteobacteria bacterium]MBK7170008.1 aminotransferase class IV [Gammaproteobacteria bacterium]MBK7519657.1 aminotransferase class IV [Gammaproteobacteria bacterium]
MATVYLDGNFLDDSEAKVSIHDRGFLFGDAVYEVVPVYRGNPFRLARHLDRLRESLAAVAIDCPLGDGEWATIIARLLAEAHGHEYSVYIQVTRGVGVGRDATRTQGLRPTVLVSISPVSIDRTLLASGIRAALLEDIRWHHCRIKATALLGNVLLRREALQRGAAEALLIRDGELTEGSSSNVFAVLDGVLRTAPPDERILRGITREVIIELACACGIDVREQAVSAAQLASVQELFICSSVREVVPVIQIDANAVGDARPGPVTRRIMQEFAALKARFKGDS